jgi:N-acetylglucosaminyl-diphospho-decaprenol L-rhamnosyltransferase
VDLEVVIVSHRDERWLTRCVESLENAVGACAYRTTIVENGGFPLSLRAAPRRRVLFTPNRSFGAANNAGARFECRVPAVPKSRHQLAHGTLELLVNAIRERPEVGLLAVRQVTSDGGLWPSLHRFPSVRRALAQAFACEKWPRGAKRLGERVLDFDHYSLGGPFDGTTGAALAIRREAFEAVGGFDERFFLLSEETDLCKRVQDAGWEAHVEPRITFIHLAGKDRVQPPQEAQMAYARLQYAKKHFSRPGATGYHAILVMHHLLRVAVLRFHGPTQSSSAPASEMALRVLLSKSAPRFRSMDAESAAGGSSRP